MFREVATFIAALALSAVCFIRMVQTETPGLGILGAGFGLYALYMVTEKYWQKQVFIRRISVCLHRNRLIIILLFYFIGSVLMAILFAINPEDTLPLFIQIPMLVLMSSGIVLIIIMIFRAIKGQNGKWFR